jgi:hypothetical protein
VDHHRHIVIGDLSEEIRRHCHSKWNGVPVAVAQARRSRKGGRCGVHNVIDEDAIQRPLGYMQLGTDRVEPGATGHELDAFLQRRQDSCVPEHERADVVRKRWPTGTDAEQFTRGRMPEYVPVEPRVNGVWPR